MRSILQGSIGILFILLFILSPYSHAQIPGFPAIPSTGIPTSAQIPAVVLQQVVDTLRTAGFSVAGWAIRALSNFIPAYTTLMIPTNEAIASFVNLNQTEIPSILLYHAVTGVLPMNILSQFPVGQHIPTLLFGNQLVVTDNNPRNFSLNGARITRPNMCGNSTLSVVMCHGIDRVLNPNFQLANTPSATLPPQLSPALSPGPMSAARPAPPAIVIPGQAIAPGAPPATVTIAPTSSIPGNMAGIRASYSAWGSLVSCALGYVLVVYSMQ